LGGNGGSNVGKERGEIPRLQAEGQSENKRLAVPGGDARLLKRKLRYGIMPRAERGQDWPSGGGRGKVGWGKEGERGEKPRPGKAGERK